MASSKKTIFHPPFLGLLGCQGLGAFNDNLLRFGAVILFLHWLDDPILRNNYVSLSAAVFGLPFLLFSLQAGRIADRWAKKKVIVAIKIFEFGPVLLAGLGALLELSSLVLVSLFLLATQSAFFGPAKYAILPEMFPEEDLARVNAWMNIATFVAILFGSVTATLLSVQSRALIMIMIGASSLGLLSSWVVESPPAAQPNQALHWNPIPDFKAIWALAAKVPFLLRALGASVFFWFAGAVTQINTLVFVETILKTDQKISGIILALAVAGICLGSLTSSRVLKGRLSLHLSPWAALGMGLTLLDLFIFAQTPGRAMGDGFFMGFFSGMYIVPINAFIQARSPEKKKGGLLGLLNLLNFVGILGASGFLWAIGTLLGLDASWVFGALGGLCLVMGALLPFLFPRIPTPPSQQV